MIAALGLDGVRTPLAFPGSTDTAAFQTYVEQVLVPELHEGDVVVFDNLKPHLAAEVAKSIEGAGAKVLPLPPYSPDYTPIEEMFSKVKQGLRRAKARTRTGLYDALGETLRHVTPRTSLAGSNMPDCVRHQGTVNRAVTETDPIFIIPGAATRHERLTPISPTPVSPRGTSLAGTPPRRRQLRAGSVAGRRHGHYDVGEACGAGRREPAHAVRASPT